MEIGIFRINVPLLWKSGVIMVKYIHDELPPPVSTGLSDSALRMKKTVGEIDRSL